MGTQLGRSSFGVCDVSKLAAPRFLAGGVPQQDLAGCAESIGFRFVELDGFQDMHRVAQHMPEWDSIEGFREVIDQIDARAPSLE